MQRYNLTELATARQAITENILYKHSSKSCGGSKLWNELSGAKIVCAKPLSWSYILCQESK